MLKAMPLLAMGNIVQVWREPVQKGMTERVCPGCRIHPTLGTDLEVTPCSLTQTGATKEHPGGALLLCTNTTT